MKTERVTLLTSAEFKAFLSAEARREGVSVAELVRTRCERRPTVEEAELVALTRDLNAAVGEAKHALKDGLDAARAVLHELRARRSAKAGAVLPARRKARSAGAAT